MFPYEHTFEYMERNWTDFDARICADDSRDELNEGVEGSGGLEIQAEGSSPGCVLGATPISESPDNLYEVRKEDGQG